jgi:hypothetical protein
MIFSHLSDGLVGADPMEGFPIVGGLYLQHVTQLDGH